MSSCLRDSHRLRMASLCGCGAAAMLVAVRARGVRVAFTLGVDLNLRPARSGSGLNLDYSRHSNAYASSARSTAAPPIKVQPRVHGLHELWLSSAPAWFGSGILCRINTLPEGACARVCV